MARVLLVDDDPNIRATTSLRLELDGHDVVTVGSAAEALAAAGRQRFDVAVLDIQMPVTDGLQLLRELRGQERTRTLPVVFYTAYVTEAVAEQAVRLADAYLTKGQPLSRLLSTINSLAGSRAS
jgi:CheY-like chemotaxis protein